VSNTFSLSIITMNQILPKTVIYKHSPKLYKKTPLSDD
jgi:hypothetical protein